MQRVLSLYIYLLLLSTVAPFLPLFFFRFRMIMLQDAPDSGQYSRPH